MSKRWRPQSSIRVKAIGLAKDKNRLLVFEVLNDEGTLKGWCPLGGGVEFGETAESALKREFLEELGSTIQITADPMIWENIFKHHGTLGHEIIFAFPILFDDPEVYERTRFQILEARGISHWVEWIEIESFKTGECTLLPPALLDKLDSLLKSL